MAAPGVVIVERDLPLAAHWGRVPLRALADLPATPWLERTDASRLLLLDTETSGLAGGTGIVAFLVGVARITDASLHVRQYFLTAFSGEAALLDDLARWAGGDTHLVSYNGKRFDFPLLATRYRLVRQDDPFAGRPHADLLYPVRTAFRRCWPDCRLATVERRLLGVIRDGDLPGAAMPQAWAGFLRGDGLDALPAILAHNFRDLVSLAALLPALAAVYDGSWVCEADVLGIARAYARSGAHELALRRLADARDRLDEDGLLELACLHRKRADHDEAERIWRALARSDSLAGIERLAIHHEHVRRDLHAAAAAARRLSAAQPSNPAHRRRIERLERKLRQAALAGWVAAAAASR